MLGLCKLQSTGPVRTRQHTVSIQSAYRELLCTAVPATDAADAADTAAVVRVLKLLSEDPSNYPDAPREGIRRVLEEVTGIAHPRCTRSTAQHLAWQWPSSQLHSITRAAAYQGQKLHCAGTGHLDAAVACSRSGRGVQAASPLTANCWAGSSSSLMGQLLHLS
jgi:hypothetical protein